MVTYTEVIPLCVVDPEADGELSVTFTYSPGTPERGGWGGPPENYDPGSPPEIDIVSSHYVIRDKLIPCGLAEHEAEKVVDHLLDEWEPPEPDWDHLRDQRRDDELTR